MSRKFIVAIAAVAAIGMSIVSTDAFARGGGGHGGGGGGRGGHVSMSHGGGHVSRSAVHARTMHRTVSRTSHVTKTKHAGRGPNMKRPHHPHRHHIARHHHRHHWWWCRHHPYRCGGTWGVDYVDGGVAPLPVAAAPVVAATPAAAVCTNDCDYFLKDEPGCYMAKRAFSTPVGDELRCVKICDEAEGKRAEIK